MKVTVFGSSAPQAGEPEYLQAYQMGKALAQAGHTVLNGGYIGTMEASAKGAQEAGGQVIGVTCDEIEDWRPVKPNAYITEEARFSTLKERLNYLIETSDAAIALPGGIGTLTEIILMWNQIQIEAIPTVPLIVVGAGWQTVFTTFFEQQAQHVKLPHQALIKFAPDVQSAISLLNQG